MLPHSIRFNAEAAEPGLRKIAASFGLPPSEGESLISAIISALEGIFTHLGVPRQLRDIGVPRDSLPDIATGAMSDWFLRGNPRAVERDSELRQVLEQAW